MSDHDAYGDCLAAFNGLIERSGGSEILLANGRRERFSRLRRYESAEIEGLEADIGVALPTTYTRFLQEVGACDLYSGFEFLSLAALEDYNRAVFHTREESLRFPEFLDCGHALQVWHLRWLRPRQTTGAELQPIPTG